MELRSCKKSVERRLQKGHEQEEEEEEIRLSRVGSFHLHVSIVVVVVDDELTTDADFTTSQILRIPRLPRCLAGRLAGGGIHS